MLSPEMSYAVGFLQGDGHLRRKTISIELQRDDEPLLHKIGTILNHSYSIHYRIRDTNFKKYYQSVEFRIHSVELVRELNTLGVPCGKKAYLLSPPTCDVATVDYVRGLVDADGALGITKQGFPFITLTVTSEAIKDYVIKFIQATTGLVKHATRNKRDGVYNIAVFKEHAQTLIEMLYYDNCVCLPRKQASALLALAWKRPANMRRSPNNKRWTPAEDALLVTTDNVPYLMSALHRSESSIKTRLWRLRTCKG